MAGARHAEKCCMLTPREPRTDVMNFPPTRIAIPLIGSIAAGAIALAFGVQALRQEAPVAIKSATAPAVALTPASAARANTSAALASAPAKPATEVPTP